MPQREKFPMPLPQEYADALKAEGQTLSPTEMNRLGEIVQLTQDTFEHMYGFYMHPKVIEKNKNLSDRIIVVDNSNLSYDAVNAHRMSRSSRSSGIFVRGWSDNENGVMYVTDPESCWDYMKGEREILEGFYESEDEVKEAFWNTAIVQTTIHETTHQYQDWSLTGDFMEMGARFYEQSVMDNLEIAGILDESDAELRNGYYDLQQEFGDKVHALAFGTLKDFQLRRKIENKASSICDNLENSGLKF